MEEQGYFEALNNDLGELKQIEENTINSSVYEFIKQNCVIDLESLNHSENEQQNEIVEQKEIE